MNDKFNVGDRVITSILGELKRGTINQIIEVADDTIILLDLDDKRRVKVTYNNVMHEPKQPEPVEAEEPKEKRLVDEITITLEDFKKESIRVIVEASNNQFDIMMFTVFTGALIGKLFEAYDD